MKPESLGNKVFTSEEGGKAWNQNNVNPDQVKNYRPSPSPDQKKGISMMQAFNLLILIFFIIDTG